MRRYNPKEIEPKWQKIWDESGIYTAKEDKSRPKKYVLEYFPYPSGVAMHVGHVRNFTIGDAISRFLRMKGDNVLRPMGWDAFGLPAENYAIKTGVSPQIAVAENVKHFKRQLKQMGFSYDWSREINSADPSYYKWTQWLFLQFLKEGLAYRAKSLQFWCPTDQTVLANEQVITKNGVNVCERDDTPVTQKEVDQWFLKITDYADRLLDDLEDLDWPEGIKAMQRNWIGKSVGAEIDFEVVNYSKRIKVFTTRPDTVYGATFLVVAPENKLAQELAASGQKSSVEDYIQKALQKSEIERMDENREKTGAFTGSYAINPFTKEKIPIWVADYVLSRYGTGAIMAVPAHDHRDWQFAKKYDLSIQEVIQSPTKQEGPYENEGRLINSEKFNGLSSAEAREKIVAEIKQRGIGQEKVNYKLHDWSISRQRYWGCPIPIIYCDKDGIVPVPEDELPVKLPENVKFRPSGQSPLKDLPDFVNTKCPKCGEPAKRETDTFDTFVDSSWYFLRFTDPHNDKEPFAKEKVNYWMPVDSYIGGAEHAVVHLLYARFWTKFLKDIDLVRVNEPFQVLRNQGMIGGADGRKMGKRYGNVVTPDELIEQGYGADALRLYELFIGPYNQGLDWNPRGIAGTYRFLDRLWVLAFEFLESKPATQGHNSELEVQISRIVNKTVKKVTQDMETLGLNTAIASLMECVNELYKLKSPHNFALAHKAWKDALIGLIQLLSPFAPHITEELWSELGQSGSVHVSRWPAWNEDLITEDTMTLAVQVNGKVRTEIVVAVDADEKEILDTAKNDENVTKHIDGKPIQKAIYVPGRLVSFVI